MKIELVPLIELPTFKFPDLNEITYIDEKNRLLIERNYSDVKHLKPFNEHQYKLSEISNCDLKKAIELNVSDLPIAESCAFFGGYGLKINNEFVLFPQCCGLLSEINDWKKILNVNFEPFYLSECHPSPKFKKVFKSPSNLVIQKLFTFFLKLFLHKLVLSSSSISIVSVSDILYYIFINK